MLISMNTFVIIIFKLNNQCSSLPGSFAFQEKKIKQNHQCICALIKPLPYIIK